jgi:hypothetical protein
VALDPNQPRLQRELALIGLQYVFRSGDPEPNPEHGCNVDDATVALACALPDIGLSVQAKREVSKLWENINKEPYTLLFNAQLTPDAIWRSVRILRAVEAELRTVADPTIPKGEMVKVHGNRFILHRVFRDVQLDRLCRQQRELAAIEAAAANAAVRELRATAEYLAKQHGVSYLQNVFKSVARCKKMSEDLDASKAKQEPPVSPQADPPRQIPSSQGQRSLDFKG